MRWYLTSVAAFVLVLTVGRSAEASYVSLLSVNSSGTINNAIFSQSNQVHPAGTGVIEPFLRVQKNDTERGYNTDGPLQFDEKSGTWTHSLLLSAVPVVDIGGVNYREFLLDINETDSDPFISLDQVLIYQGNAGNLTHTVDPDVDAAGAFGGDATLVYTMGGPANTVLMDYTLSGSGSGTNDLFLYVPDANFTSPNQYVILYSKFGALGMYQGMDFSVRNYDSTAGFEEWAVRDSSNVIVLATSAPGPSGVLLAALAAPLAGVGLRRRLRKPATA